MKYCVFTKQASLITKRLNTLYNQISEYARPELQLNTNHIAQIKVIDEVVCEQNAEFRNLVNKLFACDPFPNDFDEDNVDAIQEDISNLYIKVHSTCSSLISSFDNDNCTVSGSQHSTNNLHTPVTLQQTGIRLPRLDLGHFSGQLNKWIAFHSLFENTVHKNNNITESEKFSYLLSCLEGEPLNLVKSLPFTGPNYSIAWEKLLKRYNNSRILVSLHVNNILDTPTMHNCSVKQLRFFISSLQENIDALRALNHDMCDNSIFMTAHILRKFDHDFRSKFEHSRENSQEVPTINEFLEFVNKECSQLEAADLTSISLNNRTTKKDYLQQKDHTITKNYNGKNVLFSSSNVQGCTYCNSSDHAIYRCDDFRKLAAEARLKFVQANSLCNNCLGSHTLKHCKSRRNCNICHYRHNTLLHINRQKLGIDSHDITNQSTSSTKESNNRPNQNKPSLKLSHTSTNVRTDTVQKENSTVMVGISHSKENTILLATALVHLSCNDHTVIARAVLDSAAQHSFITESCATSLCVPRFCSNNENILGISSAAVRTKGQCFVNISNLSGCTLSTDHPIIILDKITNNLPRCQVSREVKERMHNLVLADPTFDTPASIDLLLGADLFPHFLLDGSINLGDNMPVALNTVFGYVLMGTTPILTKSVESRHSINLLTITDHDLHSAIQKFWSSENIPDSDCYSPEDQKCETHFKDTHCRELDGKYKVRLPLKQKPEVLGNSSNSALKRFKSLEHRLSSNSDLKEKYVDFMRDYQNSGHMLQCNFPSDKCHYFLPHHGILREEKLRVVFDASAITSTGFSLNDILHQGPKLHNEIPDIIIQFRRYRIVFTCDIRQMFRNIWLHEDDQKLQIIYWREDPSLPLQTFQLCTVTYGMKSSPFLANRAIQQLIKDEGHNHPKAASALHEQIYVDDALLGSDSLEEALELQQDVIELMEKGGFSLRKWTSNHKSILDAVCEDYHNIPLQFNSSDQPINSILGIKWFSESDVFSYLVTVPIKHPFTKRSVLSAIAHIYDPMGWLTPVTFWAKSFMQLLWTKGLQWDECLCADLTLKWTQFINQLSILENILIPRHMDTKDCNLQIHGFCDASETGFCASVYLRVQHQNETVTIYLLIAKSRVAPLKRVSIPRLELCGAHMLSKLIYYTNEQISKFKQIDKLFAWCDSTVVLSWIQTPAYRLKTYVANRVSEIQDISIPITWQHISSIHNPADCGSRGIMPSQLVDHPLWWSGPPWLRNTQSKWDSSHVNLTPIELLPEVKSTTTTALHTTEETSFGKIFSRFSNWTKLVHVMAYINKFITCCKAKVSKRINISNESLPNEQCSKNLSSAEISVATNQILFLVQKESFEKDIIAVKKKELPSSKLLKLSPFIDVNGLLRVGGRLSNSSMNYNAKFPILLPKRHHVTNLIIDYYHSLYLHCGPQQLQSLLNQKFWIMSARSVIKSHIFKCIRCFKCKPKITPPKMGNLPEYRVTPSRPFLNSAVDFAGPILIKIHTHRRTQPVKVYLSLFICLSTKAVHMEIVMDLTSEAFIGALTRFVSRRGLVSNLHSDNATNFVGAARQLRQAFHQVIQETSAQRFFTENCIHFHFIPPRAPHFGGLWERAIQSAKKHLKRVMGDQLLTIEEFSTLVCRVEAMLNSRPLTPLSSDPSEYEALTPGHFITGGPLVTIPETDITDHKENLLKRWQLVRSFSQHIWKRWHKEYLHSLQNRPKWMKQQQDLKVGDLVLLHEDNLPPLRWKLGRITKTMPGKDNVVRVATVSTSSGLLTRPVVKLSPLPIE